MLFTFVQKPKTRPRFQYYHCFPFAGVLYQISRHDSIFFDKKYLLSLFGNIGMIAETDKKCFAAGNSFHARIVLLCHAQLPALDYKRYFIQ